MNKYIVITEMGIGWTYVFVQRILNRRKKSGNYNSGYERVVDKYWIFFQEQIIDQKLPDELLINAIGEFVPNGIL